MIKGIVFDLDGTLVRLPIRYDSLLNDLQKFFNTSDEFKPLIPSIIKLANGNKRIVNEAFKIICNEETLASEKISTMDNAINVIDHFKSTGFLLGLVTMQCRDVAEKILLTMNVLSKFNLIITRDESYDRLEQIQQVIQNFKLEPNQVVVIGDRIHDVESARKAGCVAILANKNKSVGSDTKTISNLSELKEIIHH